MPVIIFQKRGPFVLGLVILLLLIAGYLVYWRSKSSAQIKLSPMSTPTRTTQTNYPKVEKYDVPILMYHYIRDAEGESELGKNLSVSPENFEAQLKWLQDNNYLTLKVADLADPDKKLLSKIIFEKKKPIALTFDDGYLDAYTQAFPLLKQSQMTATFYIIRNYVGKDNYMNQDQINELERAGMEIDSHTLSHPDLTKINIEDAQRQVVDSKMNATTFCYPAGKYNSTTVSLVQSAGYHAAVTTHFGIANQDSSILELPRVRVEDGSGETLGLKIEAAYEQTKK